MSTDYRGVYRPSPLPKLRIPQLTRKNLRREQDVCQEFPLREMPVKLA
jgi:hypothetical protein